MFSSEVLLRISKEVGAPVARVESTIKLFEDGATVPFIARYRKEATGNLDEVKIRDIENRQHYYSDLEARCGNSGIPEAASRPDDGRGCHSSKGRSGQRNREDEVRDVLRVRGNGGKDPFPSHACDPTWYSRRYSGFFHRDRQREVSCRSA